MNSDYFVLSKRDLKTEKSAQAKGRMIYDAMREFNDYSKALTFADRNLPSILAKRTPLTEQEQSKIRDKDNPYVVAGFLPEKYKSYCRDEWDYVPTNEAVRCKEADLEKTVESFRRDGATSILVGVELKVIGGILA